MKKGRWILFILGLIVGAVLLWFAFRDLDLTRVWAALVGANYWWLIPGVAIYFVSVWFRAWRWGFLLRGSKPVPANRLFPVVVIGYMGNNVLPFRLGELLRAYVLWRREQINVGTTLTTALLERLFDGLTMVLFVLVGLQFAPLPPDLRPWVIAAALAFLGALVMFLLLATQPNLLRRIAAFFIDRLVPARFRPPLTGLVEGVLAGLESLRSGRDVLVLFGVTVWVWLIETVIYWLVSMAFADLALSYADILLTSGMVNLATALPSPPGYVGNFEVGIKVLQGLGAPEDTAGSYVLLLHAALLIPVTLVGFYYVSREGIRWSDVFQQAEMAEESPTMDGGEVSPRHPPSGPPPP